VRLADERLSAAVDAVSKATRLVRELQRDIDRLPRLRKRDASPVTAADLAVQALIAVHLRALLGEVAILGEEGSDILREPGAEEILDAVVEAVRRHQPDASPDDVLAVIGACDDEARGTFWALDPIDGTRGFLRGRHCAVALALLEEGRPALGVLGCPRLSPDDSDQADGFDGSGVVVFAARGEGCWLASPSEGASAQRRLARSLAPSTAAPRFCQSGAEGRRTSRFLDELAHAVGAGPGWLRVDGQGKYVLLARGQADAYVRPARSGGLGEWIWDHAAGSLVATEAGAVVTDVHGRPLDFTAGARLSRNDGVIGADASLHPRLVEIVERLGPVPD
jgi:3'(2'), 5'-bisphosphate nucleotidase